MSAEKEMSRYYKLWSDAEIDYLKEAWGKISFKSMISAFKNRFDRRVTLSTLRTKAYHLGLPPLRYANENLIHRGELARVLGVSRERIKQLEDYKYIKRHENKNGVRSDIIFYRIDEVLEFLAKHPKAYDSRRIEKYALGAEYDWLKAKRESDRDKAPKYRTAWTTGELSILQSLINSGKSYGYVAKYLGRSKSAISHQVMLLHQAGKHIKYKCMSYWSDEDTQRLIELKKSGHNLEDISTILDKSYYAVRNRWERIRGTR